jgi:hypothetical protein
LIIGIIVVSNLFINYAITLVYPTPEYNKYCPQKQVNPAIPDENSCVAIGGQWTANAEPVIKKDGVAGYCNENFTCSQKYEDTRKVYERNVFIILVVAGVILVVGGMLTTIGGSVLTWSLAWSGILSFIVASVRYWSAAGNWLRVLILFIALSALIYVAVKKFKD